MRKRWVESGINRYRRSHCKLFTLLILYKLLRSDPVICLKLFSDNWNTIIVFKHCMKNCWQYYNKILAIIQIVITLVAPMLR